VSDKVRRVDWSPSEWLSGTRGLLNPFEVGIYDFVLNTIYDRGGDCPDDAKFIAGHFRHDRDHGRSFAGMTRQTRHAVDRLIKLGKLRVQRTSDGQRWLVNGRADAELNKARGRIVSAARAGIASGAARRAARKQRTSSAQAAHKQPELPLKSSDDNDLDRTAVRNHQPSTIKEGRSDSNGSARASGSAADGPAARAPDKGPRRMSDVVADLARARRLHRGS